MIHHIQQKQITRNYVKITLDEERGGGTYLLVLDKDSNGNTLDRWVETEENSCIRNDYILQQMIDQFNRDTEKTK